MRRLLPLLVASSCTLVPLGQPLGSLPPPASAPPADPASARVAEQPQQPQQPQRQSPRAGTTESAVLPSCPSDLSLDRGKQSIELTPDPVDEKTHARRRFASAHKTAPKRDFALSIAEAVDRVIAIEQRDPGVVPAGFRAAIAAHP